MQYVYIYIYGASICFASFITRQIVSLTDSVTRGHNREDIKYQLKFINLVFFSIDYGIVCLNPNSAVNIGFLRNIP